jgi:hypothetical protein
MSDIGDRIQRGLKVISTSTPGLNGTYAIDDKTRAGIKVVAKFILSYGEFPAMLPTFHWADIDGGIRIFTSPGQFMAFATAVADTVAAIMSGNNPAQEATIP